jgi:hypothetical protein
VPAAEVEAGVGKAVREHLKDSALPDGDLIRTHVIRVDVQAAADSESIKIIPGSFRQLPLTNGPRPTVHRQPLVSGATPTGVSIFMMQLENLKPGISLVGIEPTLIATVVAVVPIGDGAALRSKSSRQIQTRNRTG